MSGLDAPFGPGSEPLMSAVDAARDEAFAKIDTAFAEIDGKSPDPPAGGGKKRGGSKEWDDLKASTKTMVTSFASLVSAEVRAHVFKLMGIAVAALLNGKATGVILDGIASVGGRAVAVATNPLYVTLAILAAVAYGINNQTALSREAGKVYSGMDAYLASVMKSGPQVMLNQLKTKLAKNKAAAEKLAAAYTDLATKLKTDKAKEEAAKDARDRRASARAEAKRITEELAAAAAMESGTGGPMAREPRPGHAMMSAPAAAETGGPPISPIVLPREGGKGRRSTSRRRRHRASAPRRTRRSSSGRRQGGSRRRRE